MSPNTKECPPFLHSQRGAREAGMSISRRRVLDRHAALFYHSCKRQHRLLERRATNVPAASTELRSIVDPENPIWHRPARPIETRAARAMRLLVRHGDVVRTRARDRRTHHHAVHRVLGIFELLCRIENDHGVWSSNAPPERRTVGYPVDFTLPKWHGRSLSALRLFSGHGRRSDRLAPNESLRARLRVGINLRGVLE